MAAATLMLAAASCGDEGKLEIRSTPSPFAAGQQAVPFRIAEANGQFALGNVALALEGYRKALREDPASLDALTGLAACYDQMGRFDLSRRYHEIGAGDRPGRYAALRQFRRVARAAGPRRGSRRGSRRDGAAPCGRGQAEPKRSRLRHRASRSPPRRRNRPVVAQAEASRSLQAAVAPAAAPVAAQAVRNAHNVARRSRRAR